MPALEMAILVGVGVVGVAGVGCVALGVMGMPRMLMQKMPVLGERGRTCACCGYALDGLEEARCPECGRGFEAAMKARAARVRLRCAAVGVLMVCAALVGARGGEVAREGWMGVVPTVALARGMTWMPREAQGAACATIASRLERNALDEWERGQVADGCVEMLKSRTGGAQRVNAARLMEQVVGERPAAAGVAAMCVHDADARVRLSGVRALARTRGDRDRVLRILSRAATIDADESVRRAAVDGVARIGCDSADVVEALASALNDPSERVRERALYALASATARSARATHGMTSRLRDGNVSVREAAVWALGRTAERGQVGVMWLAEALWDSSPSVRASAAAGLRDLGIAASPALERLSAMLNQEEDEDARVAARQAVEAIQGGRG